MSTRTRQERVEFRTTTAVRNLIEQAAEATGGSLTEFAESSLIVSAQRVLADRREFSLSPEAVSAWEQINDRPAKELASLRRLMDRPSPFRE